MRTTRKLVLAACAASLVGGACGWDPARPFDRDAPPVKAAITALDAGDATAAVATLSDYLSTGACADGNIGAPATLQKRADGTYDLGLALFAIGESFGRRFGEEENEPPAGSPQASVSDEQHKQRASQIECALRVVRAALGNASEPIELRSRARYLEGNLLFLGGRYEEAVTAYDESLRLSPGLPDGGDPVARDAAWNRAVALRRIEDKKDAGNDASQDAAQPDGGDGGGGDSGNQDSGSGGDSGKNDDKGDSGADSGPQQNDAGQDASNNNNHNKPEEDAGPPPPPKTNQDERMLDQLENAPTVQQEDAKKAAQKRRVRGMQDK